MCCCSFPKQQQPRRLQQRCFALLEKACTPCLRLLKP
jgi:hypothetical protein